MKKLIFVAVVFFIGSIYGQSTPLITNSSFPVNTASQLRTSGGKNLDDGLRDLTNQIVTSMVTGKKKKIAVVEFSDLDGNVTEFGKYLAEELITRLFQTTMFNVIERRLLNKVAQEQQLSLKGIIDESSAKALGRILGVDAIVSGTITDLGTSLRINARIISTETGSIFAAAVTEINKNATVRKLLDSAPTREAVDKPKPEIEEEQERKSKPELAIEGNKIFFKEDFSTVEEGMAPEKWIGTENVMVRKSNRGKKYLTNFQKNGAKLIRVY